MQRKEPPMRESSGTKSQGPFLFVFLVCITVIGAVMLFQSFPFAEAGSSEGQAARSPKKGTRIVVGEFPPDFELPFLRFGEDEKEKPIGIISDETTFKLSSFRGRKPVCMIMSSYT